MSMRLIPAFVAAFSLLASAACGGIDLGDNPGPAVSKERGPLTNLPADLQDAGPK